MAARSEARMELLYFDPSLTIFYFSSEYNDRDKTLDSLLREKFMIFQDQ